MLLSFPYSPNEAASLTATSSTDIVIERGGWIVAVDSTIGHDRRGEIEHDATKLVNALMQPGAAGLDRGLFESLFCGHFAVIAFDPSNRRAFALRDVAGAKTLYVAEESGRILIGTVINDLALARATPGTLARGAAQAVLVLDHFVDGETLYNGITELGMGAVVRLDAGSPPKRIRHFDLALSAEENRDDQPTNSGRLREAIVKAHARRAGSDNVVLLSGGIDSSVILCALRETVERSRLRAVSCRVKGTAHDETVYAAELARAIGVPIEIVEVDPNDEANFASFEDDLLAMNMPYVGRFVYGNLEAAPNRVYFAGQDTRLHTPDLNSVDRFAFSLRRMQRRGPTRQLASALAAGLGVILPPRGSYADGPRWRRGLQRAAMAPDLDRYIERFLFHVDASRWRAMGIDNENAQRYAQSIKIESSHARSSRHLYNMIVAAKWRTQYTDDMRYLQDLGRLNGTHVALPFYDIELARLSSTLPMAQATKFIRGFGKFDRQRTRVNKALLREAFRAELPEALLLRAKAVSNTQHLLYSGVMGRKIRAILAADLGAGGLSVVRQLGAEQFVRRFMVMSEFAPEEETFLTRIFWITAMAHIGRDLVVQ